MPQTTLSVMTGDEGGEGRKSIVDSERQKREREGGICYKDEQ